MKKFIPILSLALFVALLSCKNASTSSDSSTNKADSVLISLNKSISQDEGNASLYVKRAEYFMGVERLNDAMTDANKALQLDPKNLSGYSTISSIYILMGKPQQAMDALIKAIAIDPEFLDAYLKKAKLCLVMKDYEGCAQSVQKVFEKDPHNADAFYLKGVALDENNENAKAIEAFQQAVLNNPRHYDALMQLGYASSKSNPSMAMDYFNNALKAIPGSTEAMYNLAMLQQENKQPEKALGLYTEMLKVNPSNKLALYNSGYVNMVYMEKYELGYDYFTKALKIDSLYPEAYYNRGLCSELLKHYDKARDDYKKVLQLKVNDEKAIDALNRIDKIK
jgi:tetratricopeptide (TPR) repeat protein